jgi:hypothetical protein
VPKTEDDTALSRFWSKVAVGHADACWLWTAAVDKDGYGVFGLGSRSVRSHRFAYTQEYGEPAGSLIMHTCDTPSCCNPKHLIAGTAKQNMQDKLAKGRHASGTKGRPDLAAHGSSHGNSKLTEEQVRSIREEYVPRCVPLRVFAARYGVRLSSIHYALRVGWQHVEAPCL